jgi:hypothetical protein
VIAAAPANDKPWGIYDKGAKNGLVVRGEGDVRMSISLDRGQTWHAGGKLGDNPDLTDLAKGHRQYWLRLHAGAKALAKSKLTITTVCEANAAVMPHLKDGGSEVRFEASGRALVSAGPNLPQARGHVVAGKFDSPAVTLELSTPRGELIGRVFAAAHVRSSNPPDPKVKYQIEASFDGGKTWEPVAKDWSINRQGDEPKDFWSQSLCWGDRQGARGAKTVRVRFRNDGGKQYARAEVHLSYELPRKDAMRVTFAWSDTDGDHEKAHTFTGAKDEKAWAVPTGKKVRTKWVEFAPVAR